MIRQGRLQRAKLAQLPLNNSLDSLPIPVSSIPLSSPTRPLSQKTTDKFRAKTEYLAPADWNRLFRKQLKRAVKPADRTTKMQQDPKEIAQVLRFQKSLLNLMQKDTAEETLKPRGPVSVQVRQLASWARKVNAKAS